MIFTTSSIAHMTIMIIPTITRIYPIVPIPLNGIKGIKAPNTTITKPKINRPQLLTVTINIWIVNRA